MQYAAGAATDSLYILKSTFINYYHEINHLLKRQLNSKVTSIQRSVHFSALLANSVDQFDINHENNTKPSNLRMSKI